MAWVTRRKVVWIAIFVAVAIVLGVAVIQNPSIPLGVALLAAVGAVVVAWKHRSADGSRMLFGLGESVRGWIGRRARWDDFDPAREAQPFLLMDPLRVVGVQTSDGHDLAVLDYGETLVTVLRVSGQVDGFRSDEGMAREHQQLITLHKALADPRLALDQIDWLTVVRPETIEALTAQAQPAAAWVSPLLAGTAVELPKLIAERAERYSSYVILRFNTSAVHERIVRPPYDDFSGARGAFDATVKVVRLLQDRGIDVAGGLSAIDLAALVRSMVDPSFSPEDISGCTQDVFASCPAWTRQKDAVVVSGQDRQTWRHMSGTFSLEDWPLSSVGPRWIEPVLTGYSMHHRAVITKVRLLGKYRARRLAQSQLTDKATKRGERDEKGIVDAGEAWSQETVAATVAEDIVTGGGIGIIPSVNVLISAENPLELRNMAQDLESMVIGALNAEGFTMHSTRPGVGLLTCLPLGLEVPASR